MTTRTELFTALKNHLSTIQIVNGYKTNIGNKVVVMPTFSNDMYDREYEAEGNIAFDATSESYEYKNQVIQKVMEARIDAIKPSSDNSAEVINDMLDDLLVSLTKNLQVAAKVRIIESKTGFTGANNEMVIVQLTIEITYLTQI